MSTPQQAVCPQCGGTGWKDIDSGGARRVTRCACVIGTRSQKLLDRARIPARYEHCEFESFHIELQADASARDALFQAKRFVEEYPLEKTGMLFIGPCGIGKTHLAVAMMRALIQTKGVACLFVDYRELLKDIQNSWNPSSDATEMEVLRPVFETDVIVLDDLGAIKPTAWVWDTVSLILNNRYNQCKTTLITTNYDDGAPGDNAKAADNRQAAERAARRETLGDRIGERMWSRLHEMCRKILMNGRDLRPAMKRLQF